MASCRSERRDEPLDISLSSHSIVLVYLIIQPVGRRLCFKPRGATHCSVAERLKCLMKLSRFKQQPKQMMEME